MAGNEFQDLVRMVEQSLHSKNAKIVYGEFHKVKGLKRGREVDILFEDDLGPFKIRIAYEATKKGKRLGIGQYDGLVKKYEGAGKVKVDKLVIVTRNGFVKSVIDKASLEGVELITLAEMNETKVQEIIAPPKPYICKAQFVPPIHSATPKELLSEGFIRGTNETVTLRRLAQDQAKKIVAQNHDLLKDLIQKAKASPEKAIHAKAVVKLVDGAAVIFRDAEYPVNEVIWYLHVQWKKAGTSETTYIKRESTTSGSTTIVKALRRTPVGDMEVTLPLGSDGRTFGDKLLLRIDPALTRKMLEDSVKFGREKAGISVNFQMPPPMSEQPKPQAKADDKLRPKRKKRK